LPGHSGHLAMSGSISFAAAMKQELRGAIMRTPNIPLFCSVLALVLTMPVWDARELHAAPASDWVEDFRRCLIRKPFDGGTLTISTTDGSLEIDVLWADETGLDAFKEAEIRAEIDGKQIDMRPLKTDLGDKVYAYELGPFATVAPLLSKGRSLSLAFADHAERNLRLPIGNGMKAIGFLKKCHDYWQKWRLRHP
jgi:hypothetical protein